jgi:hypothetical protein
MLSLSIDQEFNSGKLAYQYIQDYALEQKKSVKLGRCSGNDRLVLCTSPSCGFKVQLYKAKGERAPLWFISSMTDEHVNCTAVAKPTTRQLQALPIVALAVAADPKIRIKPLNDQLQGNEAIGLSSHRNLYRARQTLRDVIDGDIATGPQRLASLLAEIVRLNPGSQAACEFDDGVFVRACVSIGCIARATHLCQPILGLDGGHMKSRGYGGLALLLVARDGNLKNLTVAVALLPSEKAVHITWFLNKVVLAGANLSVPIFADRGPGLLAAGQKLGLKLLHCTRHILRNCIDNFTTFKDTHGGLLYAVQGSITYELYKSNLAILGMVCGDDVAAYVEAIDPVNWVLFANLFCQPLFGWRSSNFVESEMMATKATGLRFKAPYEYLTCIVREMMADVYGRNVAVAKWIAKGQIVTPAAAKLYEAENAQQGLYTVEPSDSDVAYVHKTGGVHQMRRVDLAQKTCTCTTMDQMLIPCRHFCAALRFFNRMDDVWGAFGKMYLVATYAAAFEGSAINVPLFEELEVDTSIPLAAAPTRKRGRQQSRRFASRGETGASLKTTYRRR